MEAAQQTRGLRRGNSNRAAKNSNALRSAMPRRFRRRSAPRMPESGQRKLGENVRMGLEINAIKEIKELKSGIGRESSAAEELSNGGDSIAISLLDLAEILDQHKIWVESGGESGVKADLCGVNLAKADLTGVNLQGAHLHRMNLEARIFQWQICAARAWFVRIC